MLQGIRQSNQNGKRRITNPYVSAADEITTAAAYLTKALQNNAIENLPNLELAQLERLAEIFEEAGKAVSEANARTPRVQTPRVQTQTPRVPTTSEESRQDTTIPRVDSNANQDEPPRYNTRAQQRRVLGNITTEAMLSVLELTETRIEPKRLAAKQFPMQFLFEVSGAVMDQETEDMMEYRHLLKNPKYREVWSKAFGKEIGRLAQGQKGVVEGTNALFFIKYEDIPMDRRKDVTYMRESAPTTGQRKQIPTGFESR